MKFYALVMPAKPGQGDAQWWFDTREDAEILLPNLKQLIPNARVDVVDVPTKSKAEMNEFLNKYAQHARPSIEAVLREQGLLKEYNS